MNDPLPGDGDLSARAYRWGLLTVATVGLLLRLWGIGFGLPQTLHADEPIVVHHALAYGTGDLNPHYFKIPPLVSYLLFAVYGILYVAGRLAGAWPDPEGFALAFLRDPTPFYLTGRVLLGGCAGTATILLVARLAREVWGSRRAGLLASACLAVTFLHVRNSHYIYNDVLLALVTTATVLLSLRAARGAGIRMWLLAGACVGLAGGVKYNGALVGIAVAAAGVGAARAGHLRPREAARRVALAAGVSVLVYLAGNPWTVLDARTFFAEIAHQWGAEDPPGPLHHLVYSLAGGIGWPMGIAALLGGVAVRRRGAGAWPVLVWVCFWYLALVRISQPHERYVLPLVPMAAVLAGGWIAAVGMRRGLGVILLTAVLLPTTAKSVLSDRIYAAGDTRLEAARWIEGNLPAGTSIAFDHTFFAPRLPKTSDQLRVLVDRSAAAGEAAQGRRFVLQDRAWEGRTRYETWFLYKEEDFVEFSMAGPSLPFDLDAIREAGVRYVCVHRLIERPDLEPFHDRLRAGGTRVARFTPYRDRSVVRGWTRALPTAGPFLWHELKGRRTAGPILEIYRLD